MEPVNPDSPATTQIAIAKKVLALENQIKGGTGWFFWIAGLSVVNSVIFFAGGSITFIVGLGATQFVDGFTSAFAREFGSGTGAVIRVIGFGLDLLIAGIFAVCGVLARKRLRWVVIIGMVLYALDGMIYLAFGEWLGVIFHAFALSGLWRGLKAINDVVLLEKSQSTGDIAAVQKLLAPQPPIDPAKSRRNLIRFAAIVIIPFVFLLGFMLLMLWLSSK